mmetsp:Transcript_21962/g.16304  ORF Transcript_21962/g.16304 Transcript_21962/m.16304 type:complete len:287 (-) Transcript_21962:451-1311(-)
MSLREKYRRLMQITPKSHVYLGFVSSIVSAFAMPVTSWNIATGVFILLGMFGWGTLLEFCLYKLKIFLLIAVIQGLVQYSIKYFYGMAANEASFALRRSMYVSVLSKHMGFFDAKQNSPAVLASVMNKDTQTINGVSGEGLAIFIEGAFSVVIALAFGVVFSWKISVVAIAVAPLQYFANVSLIKWQSQLGKDLADWQKQATLLAGDLIKNQKQVLAMANQELMLQEYEMLLANNSGKVLWSICRIAFVFGVSRSSLLICYSLIFLASAFLMESDPNSSGPMLFTA